VLRFIFIATILLVGIAGSFYSRFAALLLYVWFALFRPQEWVWFDITALRLSLVIGALLVVPCLLTGVWPAVTHPISIGMMLFLATALLSQLNSLHPDIGWFWLDFLARLILVSMLSISIVSTHKRFAQLIAVISLSIAFQSAIAGLSSLSAGGVRYAEGQAGAFVDNNGYALAIAMILPLLVATFQNAPLYLPFSKAVRTIAIVAVPFSAYTIISVFSRAGFLAMLAGGLVMILLQKRRFAILLVALSLAALAYLVVPVPEGYFDRLETIRTFDEIQEDSAISRLHFWRVALDMVRDNPLGIGIRNFEVRYDQYDYLNGRFGRERAVHSSHFQVLAEEGFDGFLVWVLLFVYSLWRCLRMRKPLPTASEQEASFFLSYANALLASLVAFLVGGAFIALSLNDLTWYTFGCVAALDRMYRNAARQPAAAQAAKPVLRPTGLSGLSPASRGVWQPSRPA
jgi:putative inorganic carbon (HCO3(-)) transporter